MTVARRLRKSLSENRKTAKRQKEEKILSKHQAIDKAMKRGVIKK